MTNHVGRPIKHSEFALLKLVSQFEQIDCRKAWGIIRRFSKFAGIAERTLRRKPKVLKELQSLNLCTEQEAPVCEDNPLILRGTKKTSTKFVKSKLDFWS